MQSCRTNPQAGAEQFLNPFMQVCIDRTALVPPGGLGLLDTLGLAFAPQLVILAGNGRHHFHQHRVDRAQHPPGELVARGVLHPLMTSWQVERDNSQSLGFNRSLELLPVLYRKT